MPRYVVIKNRGRALREEMYVLGGQDVAKAGTTGIFHTGAKEAAAAEVVRGREVHILSSDRQGRYHMTFETAVSEVGDLMVAVVDCEENGAERRELSYTAHVGEHWGRPVGDDKNTRFKALKEFVINASEAGRGAYQVKIADRLPKFAPEGETWAALEWSKEVDTLLLDWPLYFKEYEIRSWEWEGYRNDHQPVAKMGRVLVYPKTTADDQLNIFIRTNDIAFLAHCQVGRTTAFDYVVVDEDGDLLGRDRELRNLDQALKIIGSAWSSCSDVDALAQLLKAVTRGEYLESIMTPGHYFRDKAAVKKAFHKAFGKKAAFHGRDDSPAMKQDAINLGYEVIEVSGWSWNSLLGAADLTTTAEAAGYTEGTKTRQLKPAERKVLNAALKVMSIVPDAYAEVRAATFVAFNDGGKRNGFCGDNEIGLSETLFDKANPQEAMLKTLFHEAVHAAGWSYHDGQFAAVLCRWLAKLALGSK